MGMAEADARRWLEAQEPENAAPGAEQAGGEPLEVWPENWPAVGLFLRLQTQWARDWNGRRTGLRYEAVEAAVNLMGLTDKATVFDHIVEMQHAALEAFDEL